MNKIITGALCLAMVFTAMNCGKKTEQAIATGMAAAGDSGYTYKMTLEAMQFDWRADSALLHVKLTAPTGVWVGVGFNSTKGMKDANYIIGYIEDGKAVITDQHGIDPKHHKKDTELGGTDDVLDPAGSENDQETQVRFTIPLKSADALDTPIRLSDSTTVLFAYGKSKQLAQQHLFWAKTKVNLNTGAYSVFLQKTGK